MKNIALIGSTGSIGRQTLSVVDKHPEEFRIVSLSGGNNASLLSRQIEKYKPLVATSCVPLNKSEKGVSYFFGEDAFLEGIIEQADIVVVALVGFNGLAAVYKCIEKKKNIALANKESLVVGGADVTKKIKEAGIKIFPVDSEHSAVWQGLGFDFNREFKRIILTASGGAFRDCTKEQLKHVTSKDALKHPNWNMGDKITVDCATLVNKGFEVIEAKWLYNTTFDKIDVIIHRESIIHSMVEYNDGSIISQMSYPTMELPIALALSYPNRLDIGLNSVNFGELKNLSFEKLDNERFPLFNVVVEAGKKGGGYPAVVNGANEEAVKLFLQDKISFNDIYFGISDALDKFNLSGVEQYSFYKEADAFGREFIKRKFGV